MKRFFIKFLKFIDKQILEGLSKHENAVPIFAGDELITVYMK